MKTKVLFIEYAQGFGGSIISLSESLKGMRNVEPHIIVFQKHDAYKKYFSDYPLYRKSLYFNYAAKVKYVDFLERYIPFGKLKKMFVVPFLLLERFESILLARYLNSIIKSKGIQLVYSNNGFQLSAILAAQKNNLPCAVHVRGYRKTLYTYARSGYNYPQLFFAISHYVADYLQRSGVPANKIEVLHNSVDSLRFDKAFENRDAHRKRIGLDKNTLAIGIFGRISEWKGQKDFVNAIKKVDSCSTCSIKAFIVGDASDGDNEFYEDLMSESKLLVESNKLKFCGYQNEVEDYYVSMDIVVHASNLAEPFGRVVIEGMAAQAAVIGMNEGGPAEVIENGVDGILVEPRSPDDLLKALLLLCEDEVLRKKLIKNARKKILENYTYKKIGGNIENKLLQLLK